MSHSNVKESAATIYQDLLTIRLGTKLDAD